MLPRRAAVSMPFLHDFPALRTRAPHSGRLDPYRIPPYTILMSHLTREKSKLLNRIRRLKGQVEAIERALLDNDTDCDRLMQMIAACRGAMAGLMGEVIEDHILNHLVDSEQHPGVLDGEAAGQLIDVVRAYLK
jgi:FrmR/RcnR family transcriptional regulator, repressor of frmRAB operon